MHISYVSLAIFAIGAVAAPSYPRPDADSNVFGSFPFMPMGSSAVDDDDSMENPVPVAMAAFVAAEASYEVPKHAKPTHGVVHHMPAHGSDPVPAEPFPTQYLLPTSSAQPTSMEDQYEPKPTKTSVMTQSKPTSSMSMPNPTQESDDEGQTEPEAPEMDSFGPQIPKPIAPSPTSHAMSSHQMASHIPMQTAMPQSKSTFSSSARPSHSQSNMHAIMTHAAMYASESSMVSSSVRASHSHAGHAYASHLYDTSSDLDMLSSTEPPSASATPTSKTDMLGPLGNMLGTLPLLGELGLRR